MDEGSGRPSVQSGSTQETGATWLTREAEYKELLITMKGRQEDRRKLSLVPQRKGEDPRKDKLERHSDLIGEGVVQPAG